MTITLELDVDEAMGNEFERLEPENKMLLKEAAYQMLQKITFNLRSKRLKTLLEEIRRESGCNTDFDPEILHAILRTEEY